MKIEADYPGTVFGAADEAAAAVLRGRALARAETVKAMAPRLRQRAVAVAGVEDAKVLEAVREACAKVPEGKDWREARKEVAEAIGDASATRRRAETVLRANCETARAEARWRDIQASKEARPFLMYQTMGDEGVRPSHRALDGMVLPVDDPFWRTHYPPWDWGCRCTVVQMDGEQARELQEAGVAKMASEEFKRGFQARFGNERRDWSFDPSGEADWTDEKAMGIPKETRAEMRGVLSDPAHAVVNERGERENAWEYLWRTGPQKADVEWLKDRAADGREHVVVRDAATGEVLERADGTADGVETKRDWYLNGGRDVRVTHIHPGELATVPTPRDLLAALQERSECETVVAQWGFSASLRPPMAEKLRREKAWRAYLEETQRALDAGEMGRGEWMTWLRGHADVFGFKEDKAK